MANESTYLFDAFPEVSKAQWIEEINKSLKGKSFSDLLWQLEDGLSVAPFYHPDDVETNHAPITTGKHFNDWEVGEVIEVFDDFAQANTEVIKALMGGTNAPLFVLNEATDASELSRLLHRIEPEFVSLHFSEQHSEQDPAGFFELLLKWLTALGKDPIHVKGSLDFDPFSGWDEPPLEVLANLIRRSAEVWPTFKVLQINTSDFHIDVHSTSEELALSIAKGSEYLAALSDQGLSAEQVNGQLQFAVDIGSSYFVQIAKIRALRILWANVLAGYGLRDAPAVPIVAHFAKASQDEDIHTNMIRAATQAMSAIIGGADRMYVLPANAALDEEAEAFHKRIARNVQHLLQLESHLGYVVDPSAGSYYLEQLTTSLAEKAWARFQEIEKAGGYLNFKGA